MNLDVLIEQDEDGWLVGSVPSLAGCHTQARTEVDLLHCLEEAIALWLDVNNNNKGNEVA